jgi:hypothetical protein
MYWPSAAQVEPETWQHIATAEPAVAGRPPRKPPCTPLVAGRFEIELRRQFVQQRQFQHAAKQPYVNLLGSDRTRNRVHASLHSDICCRNIGASDPDDGRVEGAACRRRKELASGLRLS